MATNGAARNLVGGLIHTGRGSVPGVHVVNREDAGMAKAKKNGSYELNGHWFKVRKGDLLPDGAVMDGADAEPEPEARAKPAAPETKAKAAAPETKAKGK